MTHLHIELTVVGDTLTAVSQAHRLSKAYGEQVILKLLNGETIWIRPDSNVQDLIEIAGLVMKAKNL